MPSPLPHTLSRALAATSLFALAAAAAAWGQDDGSGGPSRVQALDAVTVSGERMDRSLRNTASSVTLIDAQDVAESVNIHTIEDAIGRGVPNVINTSTVGAPVIRGQDTQGANEGATAFFSGTTPRATINVDGRYLGHNELVFGGSSIWDLQGVEVFRGPQTTAQGANSIAGAVVVKTNDPTFWTEGAAQLQYGSRNLRRASAVLSGPLLDGELAARLALDHWSRDTFMHYVNPAYVPGNTHVDFKSQDARLKLLWTPRALPGLEAKLTLTHGASNRPSAEAAAPPFDRYETGTLSMPSWKLHANAAIADISYDFGNGLRLFNRSETSRVKSRRSITPVSAGSAHLRQKDFSNETRLTVGDEQSPWSGVAGLFYHRIRSNEDVLVQQPSEFDDHKDSLGLLVEATRRLGQRWRVTGGLRHQRDKVRRSGFSNYAADALDYDETFSALLPKLSVAYEATPDVTVGALVSRGYNPGGLSISFAQSRFYGYRRETAWNYELFTRASALGGRMQLSGNVFYTRLKDSQRILPEYVNGAQLGAVVKNADKASAYGAELGLDWQALAALRLRGSLGLLHTRINQFPVADNVFATRRYAKAPAHMLSLGADWRISPNLSWHAAARHVGSYYSTDENLAAYQVGAYTVADTRLTWQPQRNVELFAYVNNLFDRKVPTLLWNDRAAGGIIGSMLPPREFGMGIRASF